MPLVQLVSLRQLDHRRPHCRLCRRQQVFQQRSDIGRQQRIGVRHWRDAKKSNREEKEKYGIHILSFEKRKEKCRDLFSGSRREREFLPKKWRNFKHFLQFRDEKRNPKVFSLVSRREREILQTNLMIREEIETSRFQTFCDEKEKSTIPISVFFFCPKNAKSNLCHKRSFDAQIQNKDCVFDNTITKVQWSLIGQCNNYPFYCSQYQIQ